MKIFQKILIPLMLFFVLISCEKDSGLNASENAGTDQTTGAKMQIEKRSADLKEGEFIASNGVLYSADVISALEFLQRKGEVPSGEDLESLKKENVLILEIETHESLSSIFDSKKIKFDKDEAMSYMMSGILGDVSILQNNEEISAYDVLLDKDISNASGNKKVRFFLFLNEFNTNDSYKIKYFDRLFGGGTINL